MQLTSLFFSSNIVWTLANKFRHCSVRLVWLVGPNQIVSLVRLSELKRQRRRRQWNSSRNKWKNALSKTMKSSSLSSAWKHLFWYDCLLFSLSHRGCIAVSNGCVKFSQRFFRCCYCFVTIFVCFFFSHHSRLYRIGTKFSEPTTWKNEMCDYNENAARKKKTKTMFNRKSFCFVISGLFISWDQFRQMEIGKLWNEQTNYYMYLFWAASVQLLTHSLSFDMRMRMRMNSIKIVQQYLIIVGRSNSSIISRKRRKTAVAINAYAFNIETENCWNLCHPWTEKVHNKYKSSFLR